MSGFRLICVATAWAALTSCSNGPAPTPAAAKAAVSGIDLTSFDKGARPQDDLFHHVNGAWLAKTEIPPDKTRMARSTCCSTSRRADLRAIVEDAAKTRGQGRRAPTHRRSATSTRAS